MIVRESIMEALRSAVASISIAGGYSIDMSGGCVRGPGDGVALATTPVSVIAWISDDVIEYANNAVDRSLRVGVGTFVSGADFVGDGDSFISTVAADVERALMTDTAVLSYAYDVTIESTSQDAPEEGMPFFSSTVEALVKYQTHADNPSQQ